MKETFKALLEVYIVAIKNGELITAEYVMNKIELKYGEYIVSLLELFAKHYKESEVEK